MTVSGKKAIVTGGSRGIGAAIAKRLAADGADVAITYAGNKGAADAVASAVTAAGRKAAIFQADAADAAAQRAAIDAAAAALGGLDILVHNAGLGTFQTIDVEDDADFARMYGVNVEGVYAGTKAALPHIADGGRIVVIGSISGDNAMFPGAATYASTKAAVQALVRGWSRDLAPRGILVNVVQPGPIDTDLNPADGPMRDMILPLIPLGRYGRPDEVASVVSFLAGDGASFITGASIDVGGGAAT